MDVGAVVSVVTRKLTELLIQESNIFKEAIDEVKEVRESLRQMKNFFIEAEDKKEHDDEVKKWVEEFLALVYNAEDAIETFVLQRMHSRRMNFPMKNIFNDKKLRHGIDLHKEVQKINQKIKEIKIMIEKIKKEKPGDFNMHGSSYQDEGQTQNQQNSQSHSMDEKSDVLFGFKEAQSKLVTRLTDTSFRGLPFISIVGVVGSGKTALAQIIYKSSEIIGHFDCRVWVSASENLRDALQSILEQMGILIVDEKATEEELVAKIRENLQNKKYLVVLDDVRSLQVLKGLRPVFSKVTDGSKVLLTTSNVNIARFANPSRLPYRLMPLNNEDTWNLFLKKVHLPDDIQFSDSETLSKLRTKIITTCKGLPLAIILLGGFLSTKTASYMEWLRVLDHPSWIVDGNEVEVSKILALKYNYLPFHLRTCLLYLGLFPKGYKIPVRRLLRLWLAEGFVKHSPDQTPEDMVEGYLDELLNQKIIEMTRRKDGSPKICLLRQELHDIILSKAEFVSLFHIHRTVSEEETYDSPKSDKKTNDYLMPIVRRIAEHGDIRDYPCKEGPSYIQHLRSYLSFNIQKKDIPQLPENLEKLFQLRYLGLRWTFLDTLPHSVGELPYLETLDVKHTYISSLPNLFGR